MTARAADHAVSELKKHNHLIIHFILITSKKEIMSEEKEISKSGYPRRKFLKDAG